MTSFTPSSLPINVPQAMPLDLHRGTSSLPAGTCSTAPPLSSPGMKTCVPCPGPGPVPVAASRQHPHSYVQSATGPSAPPEAHRSSSTPGLGAGVQGMGAPFLVRVPKRSPEEFDHSSSSGKASSLSSPEASVLGLGSDVGAGSGNPSLPHGHSGRLGNPEVAVSTQDYVSLV
jgi:hypothetical protein